MNNLDKAIIKGYGRRKHNSTLVYFLIALGILAVIGLIGTAEISGI